MARANTLGDDVPAYDIDLDATRPIKGGAFNLVRRRRPEHDTLIVERVGTTPAQYRDGWTAPSARSETAIPRSTTGTGPAPPVRHRSITRGPRTPRSPLFHNPASSSNCGTV